MNKQVKFKAKLTHGECNGFMHSRWYANGDLKVDLYPTSTDEVEISFMIDMPCEITIVVDGKNHNTDTIVDSHGNIMQDKFIKIDSAMLANHPIPESIVTQMCNVSFGDNDGHSSFFGFNGTVTIKFDESDPVVWHFKHNHYKVS